MGVFIIIGVVALISWFICIFMDDTYYWTSSEGIISYKSLSKDDKIIYNASVYVNTKKGIRPQSIRSVAYTSLDKNYRKGQLAKVLYREYEGNYIFKFKEEDEKILITYALLKIMFLFILFSSTLMSVLCYFVV
jgi:hypothetical protein